MKLEKTRIIVMGILMILLVTTLAVVTYFENDGKTDAWKFKEEYEALNGKETSNGKTYPEMTIAKKNPIIYADYEQLNQVLNGTGVIYLGYASCPWCRNALPVLLEAASKTGISKIYYMDMKEERNQLSLDSEGNIQTIKEGTKGYKDLVGRLSDHLDVYEGLDDPTIKRIYVPLMIFVKNGEIIKVHTSTVSSQEDPYVAMTEEQHSELLNIYKTAMLEIADSSCDDAC